MSSSSPCCGCPCGGGGAARANEEEEEEEEEDALSAPLLDLEKGRLPAPAPEAGRDAVKEMADWAARRIVKFIFRGIIDLTRSVSL
ncbi:hypothetical protein ACP4OV_015068 [Aristida adscensionis]